MIKSDPVLQVIAKPIWNVYCGIYPKLSDFKMPIFRFDSRLKKVFAYAYVNSNVIRISKDWWNKERDLYCSDIIAHEIAHQIEFNLMGELSQDVHGPIWQEIMHNYGIEPLTHYEGEP